MTNPRTVRIPSVVWRATIDNVARCLGKHFADAVILNSAYHIQVKDGTKKHDVWVTVEGYVKFKLYGNARARFAHSAQGLIEAIRSHKSHRSNVAKANEALRLSQLMRTSQAELPDGELEAVFVDAGWKDGLSTIAAVYVHRTQYGIEAISRVMPIGEVKDISLAEYYAIVLGALVVRTVAESAYCPIYSDSQSVVRKAQNEPGVGNQVRWLGREKNKAADRLANMRK
jgi:hypothetical protein